MTKVLKELMTARDMYHDKAWETSLNDDVSRTKR